MKHFFWDYFFHFFPLWLSWARRNKEVLLIWALTINIKRINQPDCPKNRSMRLEMKMISMTIGEIYFQQSSQ